MIIKTKPLDMILYLDDWKRFPTAIVDTKTKNTSAIDIVKLLNHMGVKNCYWPLALINPKLQGIDPHDEDLTAEQMQMIAIESIMNPWYYFREVARVPASGGTIKHYVRFNRSNLFLWWSYFNHVTSILVQPRQTGKSFASDMLSAYLLMVKGNAMNISLVTKDESLRVETVDRLKALMDTLPLYMDFRTRLDRASTELIEVKEKNNRYKPYVAQSNEAGAHKLGRGASTATIHFDEPPFQKFLQVHYGVIIGSTGAKIDQAKEANAPWGNIMTTTAWKKNTPEGAFFSQIVEGSGIWSENLYDCTDIDDLYFTIYKSSRDGVNGHLQKGNTGMVSVYACFNHRQLGYTDQWLYETISRNRSPNPDDIDRDFFNICTSGGETHPLTQSVLDAIIDSKKPILYSEIDPKYRYTIRWYIARSEIDAYINSLDVVVGVDMSEGIGKDFTTIVFMNVRNGEVLGTSVVKESNSTIFAAWFHQLMVRFPRIICIIENKSMGVALHDALLVSLPAVGIDPYKRLYNRIVDDGTDTPQSRSLFEAVKVPLTRRDRTYFAGSYKKSFGYNTSGTGRHARNGLYQNALSRGAPMVASGVKDEMLIEQIASLTSIDGRIDHQDGQHDDLVIGWLLCLWFIFNAKNVSHYGLDPRTFLTNCYQDERLPELQEDDEQQRRLRGEMDYLLNELENENDFNAIMQLENRIALIETQLRETDQSAITAGEWISKAEEIRKRKRTKKSLNSYDRPYTPQWTEGEVSSMQRDYYQLNPYY